MKINIKNSTYIFILLSFLAGYFEYVYILLITIIIHECGHCLFGMIGGIKIKRIDIYPFGGISIFDSKLNISIKKELFCLIGGISFQILFYLLCYVLYKNIFLTYHVFTIIKKINILLISFNFLPILPLDGGKLINLILDCFFAYKISNIISIIISIIFIIIFMMYNNTFFSLLISLFLIKNIFFEIKNINLKYNKFLLERHLNDFKFKKIKKVKNINLLKRDTSHIINNNFERKILSIMFDTSK